MHADNCQENGRNKTTGVSISDRLKAINAYCFKSELCREMVFTFSEFES